VSQLFHFEEVHELFGPLRRLALFLGPLLFEFADPTVSHEEVF
jgi:hypothetical protein